MIQLCRHDDDVVNDGSSERKIEGGVISELPGYVELEGGDVKF